MKKIDDIINLLQSQQPAISNPDELTDRIMDALPDDVVPAAKPARRVSLYVVSAVAVAASLLLLFVLHTRKPIEDTVKPVAQHSPAPTLRSSLPNTQSSQPMARSAAPSHSRVLPARKVVENVTDIKRAEQPATAKPADSLDYYISQLEAKLAYIRDSCYEARIEHLIRVDNRLQRLVNQLILDGIIADTLYNTAQTE